MLQRPSKHWSSSDPAEDREVKAGILLSEMLELHSLPGWKHITEVLELTIQGETESLISGSGSNDKTRGRILALREVLSLVGNETKRCHDELSKHRGT